jgi:small-conductance mechanosensitive channel
MSDLAGGSVLLHASTWSAFVLPAGRIALIVIIALTTGTILHRLIRAFRQRVAVRMSEPEQIRRVETLGRVFRYLASLIVTLIALVLILSELGIAVAPILGAAGVVGLMASAPRAGGRLFHGLLPVARKPDQPGRCRADRR